MSKEIVKHKSDWEWTEEREKCFQMHLRGFPKLQIAKELELHRNTINLWCKHPQFVKRLTEELQDLANSSKLRRVRATNQIQETVTKLATDALVHAQKHGKSAKAMHLAKGWLAEFRSMRNEERLNFGDATENHAFSGTLNHHTQSTPMSTRSLRDLLSGAITDGTIDAARVAKAGDARGQLVEAMQQLLTEGELIRAIDEETGNTSALPSAEEKTEDADFEEAGEEET